MYILTSQAFLLHKIVWMECFIQPQYTYTITSSSLKHRCTTDPLSSNIDRSCAGETRRVWNVALHKPWLKTDKEKFQPWKMTHNKQAKIWRTPRHTNHGYWNILLYAFRSWLRLSVICINTVQTHHLTAHVISTQKLTSITFFLAAASSFFIPAETRKISEWLESSKL